MGAKAVHEDQEVMLITNEGIIIRIEVRGISVLGRITSGVKLMNVDSSKDIVVASVAKVRKDTSDTSDALETSETSASEIQTSETSETSVTSDTPDEAGTPEP